MSDAAEKPTVLVSAFEPFGGASVNASQEVARRLDGQTLSLDNSGETATIETLLVPVIAGEAERIVYERLENGSRPLLAYVALGEAGPERVVRLEKVYINWDYFSIPDNAGNRFCDQSIVPNGPAAYFATLDFAHAKGDEGSGSSVPLQLSLTAGSFLCNHLAYCASHFFSQTPHQAAPFGFIHVPSWRPKNGEAKIQAITETVRCVIGSSLPEASLPPNNRGF